MVIVWTIVHRDESRLALRNVLVSGLTPLDETIHQTLAGHVGGHGRQKERIKGREEHPHWRDRCRRVNVVIGGLRGRATFPPTCEGADRDRCLRIHRDPSRVRSGISLFVQALHLDTVGVGFRECFWGWLLAPFFGSDPRSVRFVAIVSAVDPSSSPEPFWALHWQRTSVAVRRVYKRVGRHCGSAWLWPSTVAVLSASTLGRWSSLRVRPHEVDASRQTIPCSRSCWPLRIVPRFQPTSRSARR